MKLISLTKGKFTMVDDEDFDKLSKYKWMATTQRKTSYAGRDLSLGGGKSKRIYMHSILAKTPKGFVTDHIDGNSLNNQKKNLRVCTNAENLRNSGKPITNSSGFKGVSFHKQTGKYRARITLNRKEIYLGEYKSKEVAHEIVKKEIVFYHKEFAHL
jgi:hypothetical protein